MSRNFELLQSITETADSLEVPVVSTSEPFEPRGCPEDLPTSLLVAERPSSNISHAAREEVAKLIQAVFLSPSNCSPQQRWQNAVVFCGFEAGKSVALLTPIASDILSREVPNVRVCAIDADFDNPSLHQHFSISQCAGLAEALRNPQASHRFTRRVASNLWVMCSGGWPLDVDRQAEITSNAVSAVIDNLKKSFGYILINGGCTIESSSSFSLGKAGCGLILVIEANSTRHSIAEKYKNSFVTSGINLLGAVLHKSSSPTLPSFYKIF